MDIFNKVRTRNEQTKKEDDMFQKEHGLTDDESLQVRVIYLERHKRENVVGPLLFFLGFVGAHRYYINDYFRAVLMTLTLGGAGILWIFNAFFIESAIKKKNEEIKLKIVQKVKRERISV